MDSIEQLRKQIAERTLRASQSLNLPQISVTPIPSTPTSPVSANPSAIPDVNDAVELLKRQIAERKKALADSNSPLASGLHFSSPDVGKLDVSQLLLLCCAYFCHSLNPLLSNSNKKSNHRHHLQGTHCCTCYQTVPARIHNRPNTCTRTHAYARTAHTTCYHTLSLDAKAHSFPRTYTQYGNRPRTTHLTHVRAHLARLHSFRRLFSSPLFQTRDRTCIASPQPNTNYYYQCK